MLANRGNLSNEPAVLLISHDPAVIDPAGRVVTLGDGVVGELSPTGRSAG